MQRCNGATSKSSCGSDSNLLPRQYVRAKVEHTEEVPGLYLEVLEVP